ncbi:MAG: hypothetical protein ACLURV_11360 [Gallintestinimicrobium sp.]
MLVLSMTRSFTAKRRCLARCRERSGQIREPARRLRLYDDASGQEALFMGRDIAEYDEWNEERGVEWEL